jgi:hypothetical protein
VSRILGKVHSKKLYNLFCSPHVIRTIRSRMAGCCECGNEPSVSCATEFVRSRMKYVEYV